MDFYSKYLKTVFDNESFVKKVNSLGKEIVSLKRKIPFDAIAFSGTSGSAMAFPISYSLKIPLICVRKGGKKNNSHFSDSFHGNIPCVEGFLEANKYIIIDDFIESGNTIKRIKKEVNKFYKYWMKIYPKHVATILYGKTDIEIRKEYND